MDFTRLNKHWVKIDFRDDFSWAKVNKVKKIPGRKYDSKEKTWKVPLKTKESATQFLFFCNEFDADLPKPVKSMIKELRKEFKKQEEETESNLKLAQKEDSDVHVYGLARGMNLRPYQKVAVEYFDKNERVLIGDQMGTGKTISAIASVQHKKAYPCLVVCPASLKGNWKNEWETWVKRRKVRIIEGWNHSNFRGSVLICNYSIITKHVDRLREKGFKSIICDESHYLKNGKAKRTKAVKKIARKVPNRILLSGTAVINRPEEIISQLKILGRFKENFGNWHSFVTRYCDAKKGRFGWDTSGASNLDELHEKLVRSCYIRRNKEDVLKDLPPKQFSSFQFELSNKKEYEKAEKDIAKFLKDKALEDPKLKKRLKKMNKVNAKRKKDRIAARIIQKTLAAEHLIKINELRKLTSEGKIDEAISWIENFLSTGEKLIVFAHFKDTISKIVERFDCPKITGDVKSSRRTEIVEEFQNGEHQLLALNTQAGGVGITLTAASNVAFVEIPWTWAEVSQASDRCVYEGQKLMTKKEGYKPIEDVIIGDKVYTHKGNWKRVEDVWSREERWKNQVTLEYVGYDEPLRVTEDHKIRIWDSEDSKFKWLEAEKVKPNRHHMVLKSPSDTNAEMEILNETNVQYNQFGSEQINTTKFILKEDVKLSDELLFAFGHYVGDGWITNPENGSAKVAICGHVKEKEVVMNSMKCITEAFGVEPVHSERTIEENNCYSVTIRSKNLYNHFKNWFGLDPHSKQIPGFIMNLSANKLGKFLEGYYFADGYRRNSTQQVTTVSNKLAAQLVLANVKLNLGGTLRRGGYDQDSHWSYEHTIPSLASRDTRIKIIEDHWVSPITKKEEKLAPRSRNRVYDLTVEEDHSFVVGLSTVHNCHRIGQEDSVNVYFLTAENSIDEKMNRLVRKKKAITEQINAGKGSNLDEVDTDTSILGDLVLELIEDID
jgi:superfamily II DNA or RNA helicase/intein/homing endonuclease